MARRERSSPSNRRPQATLAPKLIGVGLFLAIVPLVLGKSPLAAGLRVLAPLGWLSLVVGCALLWWQIKNLRANVPAVFAPDLAAPPRPFHRIPVVRPPVARAATGYDRRPEEAKPKSGATRVDPTAWGSAVFDVIEWRRFEVLVEALFAQAGFDVDADRKLTHLQR